MKTTTFLLAAFLGLSLSAQAQYSRKDYPQRRNAPTSTSSSGTSTSSSSTNTTSPTRTYPNGNDGGSNRTTVGNRSSEGTYTGRMTRSERENYQARQLRREANLIEWSERLDRREADLYNRRYYPQNRQPVYTNNRLLSERELCDWNAYLDDQTRALNAREQDLLDAEARQRNNNGNRRNRDRDNRNQPRQPSNNGGGMCPPSW